MDELEVSGQTSDVLPEETTTEIETAGAEGQDQEGQPAKPPVDERTSAFKELRAHNKELEKALRAQEAAIRELTGRIPQAPEPTIEGLTKPTLSMFGGDVDAYESALEQYAEMKHSIKSRKDQTERESKQREMTEQERAVEVQFGQKITLGSKSLPDLHGALERIAKDNVGAGIHDQVVLGIKRSPVAAEMFHFFESNRDEADKVGALSPRDQIEACKAIESWIIRGGYKPQPVQVPQSSQEPGNSLDTPPERFTPKVVRPSGGSSVSPTPSLAKAQTAEEYLAAIRSASKSKKR